MRRIRRARRRSRRVRDPEFMGWVKTQPCAASTLGVCSGGFVDADHAGARGLGQKADDDTCIPLCAKHHRERTDFSGAFKTWDRAVMRTWLLAAIAATRTNYAFHQAAATGPQLW